MNVSIIRRVIAGDSSDSPRHTARMPWINCSGGRSFRRKPLAPASSAS